jgi:hypothetical protein
LYLLVPLFAFVALVYCATRARGVPAGVAWTGIALIVLGVVVASLIGSGGHSDWGRGMRAFLTFVGISGTGFLVASAGVIWDRTSGPL